VGLQVAFLLTMRFPLSAMEAFGSNVGAAEFFWPQTASGKVIMRTKRTVKEIDLLQNEK
jgi:hypothetical protein